MSWFKYIVGGGLGSMVGGPFGALIGVWLASKVGDTGTARIRANSQEEAQAIFVTAMFSMFGKICKADGVVSKEEIDAVDALIEHQLRFNDEQRGFAIYLFNEAKNNSTEFSDYAKQYYLLSGGSRQTLESFLYMLTLLCWADGKIHEKEKALLQQAATEFRISHGDLERIINTAKAVFFAGGQTKPLDDCYKILGCTENDDNEKIKKSFRELAKKFHPDSITNKGVPEEFIEFANQKFNEIKEAYDRVKSDRGF